MGTTALVVVPATGTRPRTVIASSFKLKRLIALLRRAIEQLYDAISSVRTTAPCQIVIY
jgi:hypothetical protein